MKLVFEEAGLAKVQEILDAHPEVAEYGVNPTFIEFSNSKVKDAKKGIPNYGKYNLDDQEDGKFVNILYKSKTSAKVIFRIKGISIIFIECKIL